MFYNVENLFDTRRDTTVNDEEFTPWGAKYWSRDRYNRKLLLLAEAIEAAGEWTWPAFVGLAEVENRYVLEELTGKTALAAGEYGIVHADSPDPRGIDVALLYRRDCFEVLYHDFYPVKLSANTYARDILYCKGVLAGQDTLHFFVCHFPSMRGGERQSEWKRIRAAGILREKVDSIQALNREAYIVIMGDMNGTPTTQAQKVLGTKSSDVRRKRADGLYNTAAYLQARQQGTYRYRGKWQAIDHIILSGVWLIDHYPLSAEKRMGVFSASFLLEEDKTYYGMKPRPTYWGPRYIGGYSDHLPVYIDIRPKN